MKKLRLKEEIKIHKWMCEAFTHFIKALTCRQTE